MTNPLHVIEIKGKRVELLFTPSLYGVAARRGVILKAQDTENFSEVLDVYCKIMYLAAQNAWEVRGFDHPEQGDFEYTLMDFILWSAEERKQFGKMIKVAVECLTGRKFEEAGQGEGDLKKKKS